MPEISLTGVPIVAAVAVAVPLGLGLLSSVRLPSVVLEILAGVVIRPAVLGLVAVDLPLEVLAADIGVELGELRLATGAVLVLAGLLSVLAFPLVALSLCGPTKEPAEAKKQ